MTAADLTSRSVLSYDWQVERSRGAWRSLAARLLWEQEVVSSNLTAPTSLSERPSCVCSLLLGIMRHVTRV